MSNQLGILHLYDYITISSFDHDDLIYVLRNLPSDVKIRSAYFDSTFPGSCRIEFYSDNFKDTPAYADYPEVKLTQDIFYRYRITDFTDCYDPTKKANIGNLNGVIIPNNTMYTPPVKVYVTPTFNPPINKVVCNPGDHKMVMYHGLIERYKFCSICGEKE